MLKLEYKLRFFYLFIGLLIVLLSCDPVATSNSLEERSSYFPVKEFVENLASVLDGERVLRKVVVNGAMEENESQFFTKDWREELEFFIQNDINKPALLSAYQIEKGEDWLSYSLKKGEKNKTKRILIIYEGDEVKELGFVEKKENFFYSSEVEGQMYFDSSSDELIRYRIESNQEVIWSKPNQIHVEGFVKR